MRERSVGQDPGHHLCQPISVAHGALLASSFDHDPHHWLGARGADQDPAILTQLGFRLPNRFPYLVRLLELHAARDPDIPQDLRV